MKQEDHAKLEQLLTNLILAQTRIDEMHEGPAEDTISAILERNSICLAIHAFVDELVNSTIVQQSADTVNGTMIGMKIDRLG